MKWLSVILAIVFSISYLGIIDVYAQPPGPPPGMEDIEEPPLPPSNEYVPVPGGEEPWFPGPVPGPEPVPEPSPVPVPETGEGPSVNPEDWALPQGEKGDIGGEEQFTAGIAAGPQGAPEEEVLAVGVALLYVQRYGRTRAATWVGSNLSLYISGLGNIRIVEYVWVPGMGWRFHQQAYNYNPGPNRWSKMWFFADIRGWHALRAYVGGVASNWIYIYVY